MPLNGSGSYSAPASSWNPAVDNTDINSTDWASLLADLSTALSTAMFKDGQQTPTANLPMGGFKLTGLGAGSAAGNSVRYEQVLDSNGVIGLNYGVCEGRLSLTSGIAVTTGDVTAATTVYFTPYLGARIGTYSGSAWSISLFTEQSIAVPATSSQMYDVFIVDGTLALEALAWTNDTTRATALALQNGVYVKNGATTRRYLGSFRTTGVSGQTEDSLAKRYVWNYYNRVMRPMKVTEATANWSYTTATYRQSNGAAANQLDYVQGVSEDSVIARAISQWQNSGGTNTCSAMTGIGVDANATSSAQFVPRDGNVAANTNQHTTAEYVGFPGAGRHTLVWLEYSDAAGTTTWLSGAGGATPTRISGIYGELLG